MVYVKNIFIVILTVSLFTGCLSVKQEQLEEVFQSNSAVEIKKDYQAISKLLLQFKEKIDKRNPSAYDKEISGSIYTQIDTLKNDITLKFMGKEITSYKGYLQIAFSKDNIKNRNDYLIIGLYKMLYDAYDIENSYKITAFSYDEQKLQRLYKNLQILKWKIKVDKDLEENYLFLTWQNNWQLELEKKIKNGVNLSWDEIQNLEYLKNKKESIFSYSNFSFETTLTLMNYRVQMSLKKLGVEPTEMSIKAIKSLFIFL